MAFSWTQIKEFTSLPAAKQVVGGLLLVVGSLTVVVIYQDHRIRTAETGWKEAEKICGNEKLSLQREYSDSVKVLIQGFGQEKERIYKSAVEKLEAKERSLDEALTEARSVIATQNRTRTQLQKITSKVSKIVN